MTAGECPETMARLPRARNGLPVPHVAAWSSEHWHAIRHDPLVDRQAIFTAGRHGRGRPLFGVTNEPRQRACVINRTCGVCAAPLDGPGWLPFHDRLIEARATMGGRQVDVTHEPPCCWPCASWSATGCPGISRRTTNLLRIDDYQTLLQLVDPSVAAGRHERRFDAPDDHLRLGRIARRWGGAVGYAKLAISASETVAPDDVDPTGGAAA